LREITARQIDLICAPQLMRAARSPAAPNGGSVRAELGVHHTSLLVILRVDPYDRPT
jgi:hypothetical protein